MAGWQWDEYIGPGVISATLFFQLLIVGLGPCKLFFVVAKHSSGWRGRWRRGRWDRDWCHNDDVRRNLHKRGDGLVFDSFLRHRMSEESEEALGLGV